MMSKTSTLAIISRSRVSARWYPPLWQQVLIAMAVGIGLGWFYPDVGKAMRPLGDAFINATRMVIGPLVFCTVVHGIANMADVAKAGRVAIKALVYFEVLTTIALTIGLVAVNFWQPGAGMNVDLSKIDAGLVDPFVKQTTHVGFVPFLMGIIPNTFVGAFADGNVLQVLFVSVLCGSALVSLGVAAKPFIDIIGVASQMIFKVVGVIVLAAPLGAFGAIAFTVGAFGIGSLTSLGKLIIVFYAACMFFIFGVLGPVAAFCGFNIFKLLRYLKEEILVCMATVSGEVVLPRLIEKLELAGCEESIVGLVVPTGYSFNLDGTSLYLASIVVFLAQATNTPLGIGQQISLLLVLLITSKGAAGVSGAAIVVLAATLSSTQVIPVTSIALVLGIFRIMTEVGSPTNLIGNAVATIVVAKWERALDEGKFSAALNRGATLPVPGP